MIVVIAVVAACFVCCSVKVVLVVVLILFLLLLLLACCVVPFLLAYCLISVAFAPIVQQKWHVKFVTHTHTLTPTRTKHTFACTHGQLLILFGFPFLLFAHTIYCSVSFLFVFLLFSFNCLICPIANLVLLCYVCVPV